ncbi:MAG: hypothetical protein M3O30_12320 [Planctomycetota bacterium]|nr:hypothetical protein [Planctomycetota bacterium]
MLKSAAALTSISLAFGCAAFTLVSGCDSQERQADVAVQKQVDAAEKSRGSASNDLTKLESVQNQYDSASRGSSSASPEMSLVVKGRAAQLRFERVELMLGDLRAKDLQVVQTINSIEQLAYQVAGAQSGIEAIKGYNPSAEISALQKQILDITGGPSQSEWTVPGTEIKAPTILALKTAIDQKTDEIARNQFDAANLKKISAAKIDQAETFQRKSEAETSDDRVKDVTQASNLRHEAAIADAQADTLAAKLLQLQAAQAAIQSRLAAVASTVDSLNVQIKALQGDWTDVQKQLDAQMQLERDLIGSDTLSSAPAGDPGSDKSDTIADHARDLAALLTQTDDLRKSAAEELDKVIGDFRTASRQADTIRNDLSMRISSKPNDPDLPVWRDMMESLHPMNYRLREAAALQAQATVEASEAATQILLAQMMDGYQLAPGDTTTTFKSLNIASPTQPLKITGFSTLLSRERTGIDMPKPLADLAGKSDPSALKELQKKVDDSFSQALETYEKKTAMDVGPAGKERTNHALMGHALTNRIWAEYSYLIGDAENAKKHLADAETDESGVDPAYRAVAAVPGPAAPGAPAASSDDSTVAAPVAPSGTSAATGGGDTTATDAAATPTTMPATATPDAAPADATAVPATMPANQ